MAADRAIVRQEGVLQSWPTVEGRQVFIRNWPLHGSFMLGALALLDEPGWIWENMGAPGSVAIA